MQAVDPVKRECGRVAPRSGPERAPAAIPIECLAHTLHQAVLDCAPGSSLARSLSGDAEEVLFVLDGRGTLRRRHAGRARARARERRATSRRARRYELSQRRAPTRCGSSPSRFPIPSPRRPTGEPPAASVDPPARRPGGSGRDHRPRVPDRRRPEHRPALGDALRRLHPDGPRAGSLPHLRRGDLRAGRRGRVPRRGDGRSRWDRLLTSELPARTVHCLENTGDDVMRVVAVFRPAGSPAAAYYPDGTPAYAGTPPVEAP